MWFCALIAHHSTSLFSILCQLLNKLANALFMLILFWDNKFISSRSTCFKRAATSTRWISSKISASSFLFFLSKSSFDLITLVFYSVTSSRSVVIRFFWDYSYDSLILALRIASRFSSFFAAFSSASGLVKSLCYCSAVTSLSSISLHFFSSSLSCESITSASSLMICSLWASSFSILRSASKSFCF